MLLSTIRNNNRLTVTISFNINYLDWNVFITSYHNSISDFDVYGELFHTLTGIGFNHTLFCLISPTTTLIYCKSSLLNCIVDLLVLICRSLHAAWHLLRSTNAMNTEVMRPLSSTPNFFSMCQSVLANPLPTHPFPGLNEFLSSIRVPSKI